MMPISALASFVSVLSSFEASAAPAPRNFSSGGVGLSALLALLSSSSSSAAWLGWEWLVGGDGDGMALVRKGHALAGLRLLSWAWLASSGGIAALGAVGGVVGARCGGGACVLLEEVLFGGAVDGMVLVRKGHAPGGRLLSWVLSLSS